MLSLCIYSDICLGWFFDIAESTFPITSGATQKIFTNKMFFYLQNKIHIQVINVIIYKQGKSLEILLSFSENCS